MSPRLACLGLKALDVSLVEGGEPDVSQSPYFWLAQRTWIPDEDFSRGPKTVMSILDIAPTVCIIYSSLCGYLCVCVLGGSAAMRASYES